MRAAEREERKQERKGEFKKAITGDSATFHRIEEHEKLRKNRRDQQMKRMRKIGDEHGAPRTFSATEARDVMIGLQTGSAQSRTAFLKQLVLLTSSDEPQLATLHQMQVVAVLQKIMTGSHSHDQFDALLCLTNLALNDHTSTMMIYPALPYVVHLLVTDNLPMAEQAAWCLGNVAGDCDECKARVMAAGAADPLIALLRLNNAPSSLLVTLGFVITNLIRGRQFLADFLGRGLLALVLRLLTPNQPVDVVTEMAWVLAYVSGGSDENKLAVVNLGGAELLVQLLDKVWLLFFV
jgi:importin subunit alpha-1